MVAHVRNSFFGICVRGARRRHRPHRHAVRRAVQTPGVPLGRRLRVRREAGQTGNPGDAVQHVRRQICPKTGRAEKQNAAPTEIGNVQEDDDNSASSDPGS